LLLCNLTPERHFVGPESSNERPNDLSLLMPLVWARLPKVQISP
jgi:hypothetical protein